MSKQCRADFFWVKNSSIYWERVVDIWRDASALPFCFVGILRLKPQEGGRAGRGQSGNHLFSLPPWGGTSSPA
jgi:hypothetical protein